MRTITGLEDKSLCLFFIEITVSIEKKEVTKDWKVRKNILKWLPTYFVGWTRLSDLKREVNLPFMKSSVYQTQDFTSSTIKSIKRLNGLTLSPQEWWEVDWENRFGSDVKWMFLKSPRQWMFLKMDVPIMWLIYKL